MNILDDMKKCSGCSACYNICPQNAISMKENIEGFFEPFIDNKKCIECGICQTVCPIINRPYETENPDIYAFLADDEIRLKSSSGGAFSVFASEFVNHGGYVVGAAFDSQFKVSHIIISDKKDMNKIRGSKYIQSYIGDIFKKVKVLLDDEHKVMFTGCPCQVAGLKNYLKHDYNNLLTVDLICHGVPSQKDFDSFISKYDKNQIEKIQFRDFTNWNSNGFFMIRYKNGNVEKSKGIENKYIMSFSKNVFLRSSCHLCNFNKIPRVADISIGDFWQVDKLLDDSKGTSAVLINSEKGKIFFEKIKSEKTKIVQSNFDELKKGNIAFTRPAIASKKRKEYFKNRLKMDFDKAYDSTFHYNVGYIAYMSNNYGSMATNYALYKAVEDMDLSIVVLNNLVPLIGHESRRFANNNMQLATNIGLAGTALEMNNYFDSFLIGSDQNWNFYSKFCNKHANYFNLSFANDNKKIVAYASSYGSDKFPIDNTTKRLYSFWKKRFDHIGLREDYGVKLTKEKFLVDSEIVIDPVFLCNVSHYKKISLYSEIDEKEPYILAYILDYTNEKKDYIIELSKKTNKKLIVILDHAATNDKIDMWSKYDIKIVSSTKFPNWIAYFLNSDFIITDSFHGCCFSIIFEKNFIGIKNRQVGRFEMLGKQFNIKTNIISSNDFEQSKELIFSKIDYDIINKLRLKYQKEGLLWLKNALTSSKSKQINVNSDRYREVAEDLFNVIQKNRDINDGSIVNFFEKEDEINFNKNDYSSYFKNKLKNNQEKGYTYLQSIQKEWGMNILESSNNLLWDLNDYFSNTHNLKDKVYIFCVNDEASKQWNKFITHKEIGLKNLSSYYRSSYIALFDTEKGMLYEGLSPKEIKVNYKLEEGLSSLFLTVISKGYDVQKNMTSNIYINNIDYSLNLRGLNVVVIDKKDMSVLDSFNVDMHADSDLKINRHI